MRYSFVLRRNCLPQILSFLPQVTRQLPFARQVSQASTWQPITRSHSRPQLQRTMASEQVKEQIMGNPALRQLGEIFGKANFEIRLAGGAVRDLLRGLSPKDLDLATTATPQQSLELLQQQGIRVVETGLQHGTVTAVIEGEPFEITTLRIDTATDGRRAKVEFTNNWELDAERRDLTVNAMFMDLSGCIYDYFNGRQHLQEQRIEFVGNPNYRIKEDYLRILRYFRFHGRICHSNEHQPSQLEAIRTHAAGLEGVSGERIWSEIGKILETQRCGQLMATMKECRVLDHIGLAHVTDAHLSELTRVRLQTHTPAALLATLLDNTDQIDALFGYWRFASGERKLAQYIVEHRTMALDPIVVEDLLVDKVPALHVRELALYQDKTALAQHCDAFAIPTFPINGKMIKQAGVPQGKQMGLVIQRLRMAWKSSRFQLSKEELMSQVPAIIEDTA
eukprot:TRINITY_DN10327_c0_g1_i4.p1 TRINITY_DN10327_c0_g1~~TRINITY_DN10327_c0_g1_i4.p1  ORF type:complete len:450 (+),score=78.78 TRINITY_DN10327_c0_g1_i4:73-1422(+)